VALDLLVGRENKSVDDEGVKRRFRKKKKQMIKKNLIFI
jgi:hypothetical protein